MSQKEHCLCEDCMHKSHEVAVCHSLFPHQAMCFQNNRQVSCFQDYTFPKEDGGEYKKECLDIQSKKCGVHLLDKLPAKLQERYKDTRLKRAKIS